MREDTHKSTLKKNLNALDLILLGLGSIIGTGIFLITGLAAAQYAGPAIVISFIIGGVTCIFTALAYAELAAMLPVSGGAYSYIYTTMGEGIAALIGWTSCMVFTFGSATVAASWSGYVVGIFKSLGLMIPDSITQIPSQGGIINLPAVLIVFFLTVLLIRGTKDATRLNGILVVTKISAIFLFIILAIPHVNPVHWEVFAPHGFSGIMSGAAFIFMAYTGFDAIATAAEECKNPNRDLPIGIIGSLVGAATLYIIVSGILTAIVPYASLNNSEPVASAMRLNGIGIGAQLVATGAIAGMTTVILTQIYAQSRVLLVMARDGIMPSCFTKIHPRFNTPHVGVFISGLFILLISGFVPVAVLGQLASMATMICFAFVSICVMMMRYQKPHEPRPFRCPAVYWISSISALMCFGLFIQLFLVNWKPYLLCTLLGVFIYGAYGYRNSLKNTPDRKLIK